MPEKLTQGNRSIEKAFQIIEVMAAQQEPMRLQDIAAACEMSASTVLRMLASLQSRGYVQQDRATLRYFLTIKLCNLGNMISRQNVLRNTLHSELVEFSKLVGENVAIAIGQDLSLCYIDEINGPNCVPLHIMDHLGRQAHLHSNSIGKLLLSEFTDEQLDDLINRAGLPRMTLNTLIDRESLAAELAKIRACGYSIDNEESEIGLRGLAVPIRDGQGTIVCGLSINCLGSHCSVDYLLEKVPLLTETAKRISELYFPA